VHARQLKVLHIAEGFEGGIVTYMRHVLPRMQARGIETWLACSPRDLACCREALREIQSRGTRVQLVRMRRAWGPILDLRAFRYLRRLIRCEAFDVVHTHGFKAGLVGRYAAASVGSAIVVHTPHCFAFTRCGSRVAARTTAAVERRLARLTDRFVFVSDSERRIARAHGILADESQGCVVFNGLAPTASPDRAERVRLRKRWGVGARDPVVGFFGRLARYKCADHLVRAAPLIRTVVDDVRFLIVGRGPEEARLRRLIRRWRLQDAVRLTGYEAEAARLIAGVDVCVVCSKAEGMGYVVLEAFSGGTPVVASNVPGHLDLVRHGRTGLVYEHGRIDQLAEAVTACLTDEALCRHVTGHARRFVEKFCNADQQVAQIAAVYEALARHRPRVSSARVHSPPIASCMEGT